MAANTDTNNNNNNGQQRLYVIDIRLFLLTITLAMVASFIAGVGLVPGAVPAMMETTGKPDASLTTPVTVPDSPVQNASEDTTDEHNPAGQHLLVDIEGVEEAFLNSEERLTKAMVDTVKEAGLTLLSYHCHALLPSGVSCVGVLLESHISFHTWPSDGVITLDLFTCGSKPLLPVIPTIERLFGIGEKARAQWSHELRGFRSEEEMKKNYLADSSDLSLWVLSPLEMYSKKQVLSKVTKFQRIDIWDIVEMIDTPNYEDVLKHNLSADDPRLFTPELASPDRLLFLDGTLQSIGSAEKIYHEALVHPAMFAHPKPTNVAIVGGGEGATLREVLKHKTVLSVSMIEIDEELVDAAREYLPKMSDCSDLVGRTASCLDDEVVSLHYEDGRKWFIDRFSATPSVQGAPKFDVVVVDALDPEDDGEISDKLYNDISFIDSLIQSLTEEGVLVIQIGTAATIDDPRPDFGTYRNREILFNMLEDHDDVKTMLVYEEPHCGFLEPHAFLVACRSSECRGRWYSRSDQIDYQIYDRIVRTHSKKRALKYFDGTTQRSYQWPKKGWETVYCRREPTPFECAYRHLDANAEVHEFDMEDESKSSFRYESKVSEKDETETFIFATKDIPKGSYVMADHMASSLMLSTRNLEGLRKNLDVGGGRVAIIADLLDFFDDYAHPSAAEGSGQHYVEIGASALIRRVTDEKEANIEPWLPAHPSGKRPKYSPVYERHRNSFDVFMVASRDIKAGEEILIHEKMWEREVTYQEIK